MIVEIFLLLILALCILHYCTRYGRAGKLVKNIPGPPSVPIFGNILQLMGSQEEMWLKFRRLNKDYYPIFKFWTTHEACVNIRHPDDIEIILSSTTQIDKSTGYKLLHPWLKTGLLTSTGNKWQTRRKILTPAFHFNVLKKYMDIMVDNSENAVKSLEIGGNESIQNLVEFTTNHALLIICEAAMGIPLHDMKETREKYRKAVHDMGNIILYRIARPWYRNESIFRWTSKGRKQAEALKVLHGFSKKIINERNEYHDNSKELYLNQFITDEKNDDQDDTQIFGIRKKRLAMLDLLIASSRFAGQIDNTGIQEEVDTFIFEGHDTTAMGLTFILALLAEHKDIQARVRNEIDNVLNKNGGKLGYSEIQHLNYLEMCIKESLRLYPSVPFISRKLNQDLQLKNYLIPKDTILHIHIYDLHRDPNFWPEADKFNPDRFSPDNMRNRHPFQYIPFSAGPRNCIGQKFVMMELKITIAHLLHNFELEAIDLAHEMPILADLVIRPARPFRMKFIPIKKK